MKIQGLDQLTKQLKEVERFTREIDGSLGQVNFDPFDAESIEHAIVDMEDLINTKAESYSSNTIIAEMVAGIKESYRQQIIDKAAEARLENEGDNHDDE